MDAQSVTALIEEAAAAQAAVAPIIEGLEDYQRINLGAEGRTDVDALLAVYVRRRSLQAAVLERAQALREAIKVLGDDGYPALPVRVVSARAFQDLDAQRASISAALDQLVREHAAESGTLILGTPEPVPSG